jgi:hypothetical protein
VSSRVSGLQNEILSQKTKIIQKKKKRKNEKKLYGHHDMERS